MIARKVGFAQNFGEVKMRKQLNNGQVNQGIDELIKKLYSRLAQKGYGTFTSKHEILGVITEEYQEFVDAVHNKDYENMKEELLDIAVACVFGYVCIEENTVDW
jgi:phosphoribosyl-ATP pyrophosphohydrolase